MNKKSIILMVCLLIGTFMTFSQNNNIFSGTVTDEEGSELIGATVYFEEPGIRSQSGLTIYAISKKIVTIEDIEV